jgi:hypothetical protein
LLEWKLETAGRRTFGSSASRRSYDDTIANLKIHKDTKVLCQGFTGKTVCSFSLLLFLHLFATSKLVWSFVSPFNAEHLGFMWVFVLTG